MKLIKNTYDLATSLKLECKENLPISNFHIDSRDVKKHSVFFGLHGINQDGSFYAEDAIKKGASLAIIKKSKVAIQTIKSKKVIFYIWG